MLSSLKSATPSTYIATCGFCNGLSVYMYHAPLWTGSVKSTMTMTANAYHDTVKSPRQHQAGGQLLTQQ